MTVFPPSQDTSLVYPKHLALIMDGNGRWAQERGLKRRAGHQQGADVLQTIIEACVTLPIMYLTVFAFSTENWSRPASEVRNLMTLLDLYLRRHKKHFLEKQIVLHCMGKTEQLPARLRTSIHELEKQSQDKAKQAQPSLFLQIALNYGGQDELADACRAIAQKVHEGTLNPDEITKATLENHLYLPDLPHPDFLIRTGGNKRLSNYLMWQLSYTELCFLDKFWPDFTVADLKQALSQYRQHERRFGGLPKTALSG